jgi:hypothetical protein
MKIDFFRYCKCLRYLGHVMILVVLGLQSLVFYAVAHSYARLLRDGSLGIKVLALLVLASFTAVVRGAPVLGSSCSVWQSEQLCDILSQWCRTVLFESEPLPSGRQMAGMTHLRLTPDCTHDVKTLCEVVA